MVYGWYAFLDFGFKIDFAVWVPGLVPALLVESFFNPPRRDAIPVPGLLLMSAPRLRHSSILSAFHRPQDMLPAILPFPPNQK